MKRIKTNEPMKNIKASFVKVIIFILIVRWYKVVFTVTHYFN